MVCSAAFRSFSGLVFAVVASLVCLWEEVSALLSFFARSPKSIFDLPVHHTDLVKSERKRFNVFHISLTQNISKHVRK